MQQPTLFSSYFQMEKLLAPKEKSLLNLPVLEGSLKGANGRPLSVHGQRRKCSTSSRQNERCVMADLLLYAHNHSMVAAWSRHLPTCIYRVDSPTSAGTSTLMAGASCTMCRYQVNQACTVWAGQITFTCTVVELTRALAEQLAQGNLVQSACVVDGS